MSPVSVVLHVGLPKTGTTFLQRILAENRGLLRARGVSYPFLGPGSHFHGAVEVRGSAAKFGLDPAEIAGTWRALCDHARGFEGTTILSHEVLAGATPDQIGAALEPLSGLEVRIVVTSRDLGRQATAHWQEEVKLGHTGSFADFERDQVRSDSGRDLGPDAGGVRPHFWHAQDAVHALDRWTERLGPGAGHLVIAPRPDAEPLELWRRFCSAAQIDDREVVVPDGSANISLAGPDIALLRAVNLAIGDRLERGERNRIVKREWAEGELAARSGSSPQAPHTLAPLLDEVTAAWSEEIRGRGYVVHGDLSEWEPLTGAPGDPPPDVDVREGEVPADLARSFIARGRSTPRWRDRLQGRRRS
ncbi:hypothetical protein [Nocardioides salsibiostraticola]